MASQDYPIFRSALELCVYIETIVKSFDKYKKAKSFICVLYIALK